jgi:two-component sensor histidine kinase
MPETGMTHDCAIPYGGDAVDIDPQARLCAPRRVAIGTNGGRAFPAEILMPDQAQPTWNEADRLAALREYDILDAPPGTDFDDFVQIAAHVCEAPIAVVNLIDEARQVFVAETGLGIREMPVDVSICAHAILQTEVMVVPDLSRDPRFDCNPLVAGEAGLRFYGGALLETSSGLPLGTVCVLDYEPRPDGLSERQKATLRALARQVMTQLELRRTIAEKELLVLEAHHRVKNSLQMLQSLMTLQARTTVHEEARQQLQQSAARIHTFGAMHEHLYTVGAAMEVNLRTYLRSILNGQEEALASMHEGRGILFEAPGDPSWPASDAPSVGLVVMELVTNALKYGEGTVTVTVHSSGHDTVITVEDEGNGLPSDYLPSTSMGLGMRVLTGLLKARRGRLEIDRTRGHTCFVATLREAPPRN